MSFQIPDDAAPLHESSGDASELARAVRISLSGLDLRQPASFSPASPATADFDWQNWLRGPFADELGEAFVNVFRAAGQMQVRELMEIDGKLRGGRSREAGSALLGRLEKAKNLRVVERMRAILGDSDGPHFATAFAVECAEFHLPLRSALVSYLYGEWRCGMAGLGGAGSLDAFATSGGSAITAVVGALLTREAGPFDQAAGL